MFCDSAYHYTDDNYIEAYSNVKVYFGNKITLFGDKVTYDANTKISEVYGNVILSDSKSTLTTSRLTYYRNESYGYYPNKGILKDAKNELSSLTGYYYTKDHLAFFKKNVKLINIDYTLTSDTLKYDTETETAFFHYGTHVTTKDSAKMYTEKGYYQTKNDRIYLNQNSYYKDSSYVLYGDTMFYDEKTDDGWAKHNVLMRNVDSTIILQGQKAIFHQKTKESYLTNEPSLIYKLDNDTLILYADTLYFVNDSLKNNRKMRGYNNVRLFMNEIQGIADSVEYNLQDSIFTFFQKPVLWSDSSQVTGDTISLFLKNNSPDSLAVNAHGFIISQEDSIGFNQVKGKNIYGKFIKNDLVHLWVFGNSESIYFAKEEDKYTGMNKSIAAAIEVFMKENKPTKIKFLSQPEGTFFPFQLVKNGENILEGFKWLEKLKPIKPIIDWPKIR